MDVFNGEFCFGIVLIFMVGGFEKMVDGIGWVIYFLCEEDEGDVVVYVG